MRGLEDISTKKRKFFSLGVFALRGAFLGLVGQMIRCHTKRNSDQKGETENTDRT